VSKAPLAEAQQSNSIYIFTTGCSLLWLSFTFKGLEEKMKRRQNCTEGVENDG